MHTYYRVGEELDFSISGVPSAGYSESALRFGLMDVNPIEVVETVKKFGMKFRRVTRSFELLKPATSYSDFVAFKNETILGSINIPKWFDAEKLIKAYSQRSIQEYEQDKELQTEIEKVKGSERIGRPLLSFIQYMKQRFESKKGIYLEVEAHRFLNSNFPLSFYNKLVVFDNTYYDFLKVMESVVRVYEFRATSAGSRDFELYKRKIAEMKRALRPLIDRLDECSMSTSRIKKYVSIWNSKDYKEIFHPEFLDIKKLDYPEFTDLCRDFNVKLREARGFLLDYSSRVSEAQLSPDILKKHVDSESPTTKLFGKLVNFPTSELTHK